MGNDGYAAPAGYGEGEYVEKRSRFLGKVWRVQSESEALAHLSSVRDTYWDASHNVFCYRIRSGGIMRYSDDGEPGGTAGMPALNVFLGEKLDDFCCIITRYFGGTLLGAGGLSRAYAHTAKIALEAAGIADARKWRRLSVCCGYGLYERLKRELIRSGASIEDTLFTESVRIETLVPSDREEMIRSMLVDVSAGTARCFPGQEEFRFVRRET